MSKFKQILAAFFVPLVLGFVLFTFSIYFNTFYGKDGTKFSFSDEEPSMPEVILGYSGLGLIALSVILRTKPIKRSELNLTK